jgi:hypothetical protein
VPTFVDRGVSRGQRCGSPTVVNLSFLYRQLLTGDSNIYGDTTLQRRSKQRARTLQHYLEVVHIVSGHRQIYHMVALLYPNKANKPEHGLHTFHLLIKTKNDFKTNQT